MNVIIRKGDKIIKTFKDVVSGPKLISRTGKYNYYQLDFSYGESLNIKVPTSQTFDIEY